MAKATHGPGPGSRSTEPAQAAIGSAQTRLVTAANLVRPQRSTSRSMGEQATPSRNHPQESRGEVKEMSSSQEVSSARRKLLETVQAIVRSGALSMSGHGNVRVRLPGTGEFA